MASKRKLKLLLNIGYDDQKKYGIPDGEEAGTPPKDGEVISVDEDLANVLVNVLKCAKDYDASEEAEHQARVEKADDERRATAQAAGMIPPTPPGEAKKTK